ncbi:uncharacterized protein B0303.7-like isoform X2 [Belonocnema kinseyi]|nr:uncharacterized protein B0303.7-like isoform X2 [Belonocnema kinseyi]
MRIPTRAAPRPPGQSAMYASSVWNSNNDLFGDNFVQPTTQKKKPPPRPPPPKFQHSRSQCSKDLKPKKPARPTELLTNIFTRKETKRHQPIGAFSSNVLENSTFQSSSTKNGTVCLIDLSPPGSPTFTTRSSSDGLSVDSFGSDGNSNPSVFTSSGSTSQTESAFEDDFDFFGGLDSNKKFAQNDPWKVTSDNKHDPFSPTQLSSYNNASQVKQIGDACFFAFNKESATANQVPSYNKSAASSSYQMPTIIRAKPRKEVPLKSAQNNSAATSDISQDFFAGSNFAQRNATTLQESVVDFNSKWKAERPGSESPPMPSIPPPTLPPEFLTDAKPKPQGNREPYGIALYNFPETQVGDLALKEGDTVILLRVVNDEWMEGRIGNREGMFPANFIDIKVPIPGASTNIVNALYTFRGETWEDLPFEEGARIKVLSRISNEWLYGECDGKRGQFPANFVDRVPSDLPNH